MGVEDGGGGSGSRFTSAPHSPATQEKHKKAMPQMPKLGGGGREREEDFRARGEGSPSKEPPRSRMGLSFYQP